MAWVFNEEKYNTVLNRLIALEIHQNDLAVAIDNYITLEQLQELLVLLQTKIDTLNVSVASVEQRITAIEEEPLL